MPLEISISRESDVPLGTQLAWKLKTLIATGDLAPGEQLPGARELGDAVGVNVNTVRGVFRRLEEDGLLRSEHGRGTFTYGQPALDNLRANLQPGGLLLADACCGKKAFDASFRAMVARLFPDKRLEQIPTSDELFGRELNGSAIATVRCRRERADGSGPEADLQEVLAAPVVFLGVSLPEDGWHAPNEKVDVAGLLKGAEAAAYLWEDLARNK